MSPTSASISIKSTTLFPCQLRLDALTFQTGANLCAWN